MKKVFASIALIASVIVTLCSCSTTNSDGLAQVAVQYATLKAIEDSDRITPDGVIRYTELARGLVEQDQLLNTAAIASEIMSALDAEELGPADRILAQALVLQIQAQFQDLDLLDPGTQLSLLNVLGWIEQAARLSAG